jgi:DNA-binding transcriptional regulator YiaG
MITFAQTSANSLAQSRAVAEDSTPVTGAALSKHAGGTIRARVGSAVILGGVLLAGPGGTSTSTAASALTQAAQLRLIRDWTSTANTVVSDSTRPSSDQQGARSEKDSIRWLHQQSGLTWDQLARLFGVSRRAVHLWATGSRMNATNSELLAELVNIVDSLPASDSSGRRAALLAVDVTGRSLLDNLRARHSSSEHPVTGQGYAPDQLLGAIHDPDPRS